MDTENTTASTLTGAAPLDLEVAVEELLKQKPMINLIGLARLLPEFNQMQIKVCLDSLEHKGAITKDDRYYYHHITRRRLCSKPRTAKVCCLVQSEENLDIGAIFEQITTKLNTLLNDVHNAVETVRRLQLKNQDLVEKLVKINTLLHSQKE